MAQITVQQARELFGEPTEIRQQLRAFKNSTRVFSSEHPRLIDEHLGEWVAVVDGDVRASSSTLPSLLQTIDALELPRRSLMVRFIEEDDRALIL